MPQVRPEEGVRVPPELMQLAGGAVAVLAVVATGSGILSLLPAADVWMRAAAYAAPASLAFAVYWWVRQGG
jgi:hypothetical protein